MAKEPKNRQKTQSDKEWMLIQPLIVLVILILAILFAGYISKDSLFILLTKFTKEIGIAVVYVLFFVISLIGATVLFGVLKSTGAFGKTSSQESWRLGGAAAGFLIFFMFLTISYNRQIQPGTMKFIRGNIYFEENLQFSGPVGSARIVINAMRDAATETDSAGNFSLAVPGDLEGKDIELQIWYHTDKYYLHKFRWEDKDKVIIGIPRPSFKPEARMTGQFNVAVATFEDRTGVKNADIGNVIAQSIFSGLTGKLRIAEEFPKIQIGQPERVGKIEGDNFEKRAEHAAKIAEEINAHVIIYGLVETENDMLKVTPQFYVLPIDSATSELAGEYALGYPLYLENQNSIISFSTHIQMESRISVLTDATLGLFFYKEARYDKALEKFQSALSTNNNNDAGMHVIHVLIGNSAGKLGTLTPKSKMHKPDGLDIAENAYKKALEYDPEYSRAYMGLASVFYCRASNNLLNKSNPAAISSNLERSFEFIFRALNATNKPLLSDIDIKGEFSRGQCYLIAALAGDRKAFDSATTCFNQVISNEKNSRIRELIVESHGRLGLIFDMTGDCIKATKHYKSAADISIHYDKKKGFQAEATRLMAQCH